jgi:hypothetical protein
LTRVVHLAAKTENELFFKERPERCFLFLHDIIMNQPAPDAHPEESASARLRRDINKYPGRFLLFYLGIALMVLPGLRLAQIYDMHQHGQEAPGIVVDIVYKDSIAVRHGQMMPIVRFEDNNGVVRKFLEQHDSQPVPMGTRFFEKGDKVLVSYMADDPQGTAMIDGPYDWLYHCGMFGIGAILFGQWLYLMRRRIRRLLPHHHRA